MTDDEKEIKKNNDKEKIDDKVLKKLGKLKQNYNDNIKPSIEKTIVSAKDTIDTQIKPTIEKNLEKAKTAYSEKIEPEMKKTIKHSKKAIGGMDVLADIKKNFWRELFTNGLALLLAFSVAKGVSYFFVVNGFGNLFGFGGNQGKIAVSEGTLEVISFLAEFIVGLFVFTFVEKFVENFVAIYMEDKEKDDRAEEEEKKKK